MSFTSDNFNKLDILIVAIDVVLYTLDVLMGGGAGPIGAFAKSLRGLRILRLLRVLRLRVLLCIPAALIAVRTAV